MASGYYIDSNGDLRLKNDDSPEHPFGDLWAGISREPVATTSRTRSTVPAGVDPSAYPWPTNTDTKAEDPYVFFHENDVAIPNWRFDDGSVVDITWGDLFAAFPNRLPPRTQSDLEEAIPAYKRLLADPSLYDPVNFASPDDEDLGGGSGGGGRGRSGGTVQQPVYLAPNREEVEEQLKSYVVATTGTNDALLLKRATDAYLAADKAAWDLQMSGKGGVQPSPFMSAKNIVRESEKYKAIHQLRPDSVDEMEWVTSAQGKLRSLGLSASRAEQLGIDQAQSGSNDSALLGAAEKATVADSGLLMDSQRSGLVRSARAVMGLI